MKIPALIMAGGKGKRMRIPIEKPLVPFLGKPLIDWTVEAVKAATKISDFFVVTSKNSPKTEERCIEKKWKFIRTEAKGYHYDLKQAVLDAKIEGPILTIPADLPLVTGNFIDRIITTFEGVEEKFLAVFVPINKREELDLSVSSIDEYKGRWYAVSGVNIIDCSIIQTEGKIDTNAVITEEIEVLLNINTLKDLDVAKTIIEEKTGKNIKNFGNN